MSDLSRGLIEMYAAAEYRLLRITGLLSSLARRAAPGRSSAAWGPKLELPVELAATSCRLGRSGQAVWIWRTIYTIRWHLLPTQMLDGIWINNCHLTHARWNMDKILVTANQTLLCFFEFRSFWYIWTVAGPAGVIGPLQRPNKGGRTTKKK